MRPTTFPDFTAFAIAFIIACIMAPLLFFATIIAGGAYLLLGITFLRLIRLSQAQAKGAVFGTLIGLGFGGAFFGFLVASGMLR